jgi:prepilin-type N-terminal cleavage/methylation domain-containing protein
MRRKGARHGFTLLELMVTCVIAAIVIGSVGLLGLSNQRAYQSGTASADLEVDMRRTLDHLVQELQRSGASVLIPDPAEGVGGSDVTYCQAVGATGGATVWSKPFRVRLEYEEGELDDGLDNNGNGLADEGRLVWTRDLGEPNESTRVLCHRVSEYQEGEVPNLVDDNGNGLEDERGFSLERVGDALVIRLSLECRVPEAGLQTRALETSVKLRT